MLKEGEYYLTDLALLESMRLSRDVKAPDTGVVFVTKYTRITPKLLERLERRGIDSLFAEPIREKSIESSVAQMEKTFVVIEDIVNQSMGEVEDVAQAVQDRQQLRSLEHLIRENLDDIENLFASDPTEKLMALTQHHSGTARHSIIASFHLMALGRELGWSDEKIVRGAVAVFNHDVGKVNIKLETLDWPGRLDSKQWQEMQMHTLYGGRLLYREGQPPDLAMLTALLHHEWHSGAKGKGYGGLTLFADFIRKTLDLEISKVISKIDPDDLDIIQASSLVDMVSALEESRAYKRRLDSFKVLIIMNTDAMMGHFNPAHYAAWHRIYLRQNPVLLPVHRRVALPREKERRIFYPNKPKKVPPIELLTFQELDRLGFMSVLRNVGMDVERIRRRGGLLLKVVRQIKEEKKLDIDCSPEAIASAGVQLVKDQVVTEQEFIELDVWREWLTWDELERCELLAKLKTYNLDLSIIRADGGISLERLRKREIQVNWKKVERLGIKTLKEWVVKLPGSENRLTSGDLEKLGITDEQLKKVGCLDRVKRIKSGVPLAWLTEQGLVIKGSDLSKKGIDPVRKVFYDILVTKEVDRTRGKFIFMREGDDFEALSEANERGELEPIQNLLFNKVGEVVMDFADILALPNLSGIVLGSQWGL